MSAAPSLPRYPDCLCLSTGSTTKTVLIARPSSSDMVSGTSLNWDSKIHKKCLENNIRDGTDDSSSCGSISLLWSSKDSNIITVEADIPLPQEQVQAPVGNLLMNWPGSCGNIRDRLLGSYRLTSPYKFLRNWLHHCKPSQGLASYLPSHVLHYII